MKSCLSNIVFSIAGSFFVFYLLVMMNSLYAFSPQQGQITDQHGKIRQDVLFSTTLDGMDIFLTKNGFIYQLTEKKSYGKSHALQPGEINSTTHYARIDILLSGMNTDFKVHAKNQSSVSKCYSGAIYNGLPHFNKVVYKNVYDHIDLVFYNRDGTFKYDFIIYPGGTITDIQLEYQSPFMTNLKANNIYIETSLGKVQESIPASFIQNEARQNIDVRYTQVNPGTYALKYDASHLTAHDTVVIDPMPHRVFGTYSGGSGDEYINAITIDELGNEYIAGHTNSTNNIATSGAFQGSFSSVFDVFLIKYDENGNKIWGTYFGGDSYDRAYGIDYHDGKLYVTGSTYSSNFATNGVHQSTSVDNDDAFIALFDTTGSRIWSTYYGGDLHDFGANIVVDNSGSAYITGHTQSTFNISTPGAHQVNFTGNSAAFIAKFDNSGQLLWGSYYGSNFQEGWDIALDNNENPIFTGFTNSTTNIATSGTHQTTLSGNHDAFIAAFDPSGSRLWGTYYGGTGDDFSYGLTVDEQDRIFITGNTTSPTNIHYNNGYQNTANSNEDGFLAQFTPSGGMIWGTYLGGDEADYARSVTTFRNGVIASGFSQSSTAIGTSGAYQEEHDGQYDAFLLQIDANGSKNWGTYYGGPLSEEVNDLEVNPSNEHIVFTGFTSSSSGIASNGAEQTNLDGGLYDGFLVRMCAPLQPQLQHNIGDSLCDNQTSIVSIDSTLFDAIVWQDNSIGGTLSTDGLSTGQQDIYVSTVDTNGCPTTSDTLKFSLIPSTQLDIQNTQSSYCEGDTVELFTNDDFSSYTWSTGSTDTLIAIDTLQSGTYEYALSAQNNVGCMSTDSISVTIFPTPNPEINVQGSANFCLNESVDIGVQNSYTNYLWQDGQTSSTINLQSEDSVWVYVENSFGCGNFSDTVFVDSDLLTPVITTNSTPPFCEGDTIELGVNNSYDDYIWNHGGIDSISSVLLNTGVFYTTVEVSNQCGGNTVSDTFEIEVVEPEELTIHPTFPDTNCVGAVYSFAIDTTFQNTLWSNGETDWTTDYAPGTPGNYQAALVATDSNGCQVRDTLYFTIENCYLELVANTKSKQYTIYPNPSKGIVQLIFPASNIPNTLKIVNATGKHIQTIPTIKENPYSLDMKHFTPGLYYIIPEHPRYSLPTKKVLILR